MSIRVLNLVWEHSEAKGSALLLLLAVADYADEDGVAYPSVAALAKKSRMSERNTQYALKRLEQMGELAIKPGEGPRGANLYRVLVERNLPLFEPDSGGAKLAGAKFAGCKTKQDGVQPVSERGAIAIAPEPSLTIIEPSSDGGRDKRAKRTRPGADYTPPEHVVKWAHENGYGPYLHLHVEKFRDTCATQKRKPYADLDAAFRNCVRDDWGHVRRQAKEAERRGEAVPGLNGKCWWQTVSGIEAKAKELGLSWDDGGETYQAFVARVKAAAGVAA